MSDLDADVEAELSAIESELDAKAAHRVSGASTRLLTSAPENKPPSRLSSAASQNVRNSATPMSRPSSATGQIIRGSTSTSKPKSRPSSASVAAGGQMNSPRQPPVTPKEGSNHSKDDSNPSPRFTPRSLVSRLHSPRLGGHSKIDIKNSEEASMRSMRRGSAQSLISHISHHSEQDLAQLKMLEASAEEEERNENNHVSLLPTNIPGMDADGSGSDKNSKSLVYRLLHANGADVGAMEQSEEEPEGRQYARAGRPFLMMRPAKAALSDFSNALPENENSAQFVKQQQNAIAESDGNSSSESDGDSDDDDKPSPGTDPTVTERVQKETNNLLSILHLKSKKKKKKKRGKGICALMYIYRRFLFVMLLSFSIAGGVQAWQGVSVLITEDVPVSVLIALPGLLSMLYLICAFIEHLVLGIATKMLDATPWSVRNIITVLDFHFRIISMFIIADVTTNIWLNDYRNTDGALYLRGTFRSVYAVSICIVVKRILIDASIHSISRTHYAHRVKQTIRAEDYLDMVASTGASPAVREKLKARRRLGTSWRSYGFTERSRRLTMQAMMLPYVRTQDDISEEVAYYFSTDMIIEVNTVRGMRVLAYVLFDTLVKHVQYLQGLKMNMSRTNSASSCSVAIDGYESNGGGNEKNAGGNGNIDGVGGKNVQGTIEEQSAVAVDSLTFAQWNSCFSDRAQAQRARKMIFTPRQLLAWRDNKSNRTIRRQDFVQACVGLFITRQLLSSQVTNFNKLSTMISNLVSRLLMVLLIFVLAACFEVDVRELLVSASAIVLSVSFALGSSISRGIESIIFVFGTYAYSIGDRVKIGNQDSGKAAFVQSVNLLTTTFRQTTGEIFIMSNADLARQKIFNLRRSTNAVVVLSFVVSFNTVWSAIDQLKGFIMQYLEKHTSSWKPGADLYVNSLKQTESMEIEFWIESVHSWQSSAIVGLAKTKLIRQIRFKMTVLGIKWEPTPQRVQVEMMKSEGTENESDADKLIAEAMKRPLKGRSASMAVKENDW